MTEQEIYDDYVDYCAYIGTEPLSLEQWRKQRDKLPDRKAWGMI